MSKRVILPMLVAAMAALTSWAAVSLSAASKLMLVQRSAGKALRQPATTSPLPAFIELSDPGSITRLQQLGVAIDADYGNFVTARIPGDALASVLATAGVAHVSLAQPLHWCNDSALACSDVGPAHHMGGHIGPFTGKGVIVGVVDTGIDFNHINFMDDTGRSRVCAVYMPADSTGTPPVVDGLELPGSCYEQPWEIASLTADSHTSSHGSHTLGTAAGSFRDNGWNGVAVDADIVACGLPAEELTDVNIAHAVKYICDYAGRVGKPCVINLSIGSNDGPNDGSSFLCRVFSSLSAPGRMCVVSAGNDGEYPVCFRYSVKHQSDTVTTFLRNRWGGLQRQGYVSMWSNGLQEHRSRLVVVNRSTGKLEYASPVVGTMDGDSVFVVSGESDAVFGAYYQGEIMYASALEPAFGSDGNLMEDQRFHSYWVFDVESLEPGHLVGIQYFADGPVDLVGWCTQDAYFYAFGMPGAVGGSPEGSISDLATTDDVISVGAYCSRNFYETAQGGLVSYDTFSPAQVASFSSYGPDENGIQRPDVCAPGAVVISSANRFDDLSDRSNWPAAVVSDGMEYPYYPNKGTSMSAPVVTGAVALMLQANPSLTAADVREVLKRSSARDEHVLNGNAAQWGAGKLDVWAAVNDVIRSTIPLGDVNDDGEVNIADVQAIIAIIQGLPTDFATSRLLRADVDQDTEINISDINRVIGMILK